MRRSTVRARRAPEMLRALADPQRIAILRLVRSRELPAGEIAGHFATTRQAVSQNLRLLAEAGLVDLRRAGTRRLYKANTAAFDELRSFLDAFWDDRLVALKRAVEDGGRKSP
ncbi:MAG: metalloregulator ArsR/SmtB family transcription factor [Bauldia sp.]